MKKILFLGVHSARVALLAGKADVKYNPDKISPEIIAQEVNSLGFTAEYLPEASSGGGTLLELKVMYFYPCLLGYPDSCVYGSLASY